MGIAKPEGPDGGSGPHRLQAGALTIVKESLAASFHWRQGGLRQGLFHLICPTSTTGITASAPALSSAPGCVEQRLAGHLPSAPPPGHQLRSGLWTLCSQAHAYTHAHTLDITSPFFPCVPTRSMAFVMLCYTCMLLWGS